jgi:hypothetical protein
MESFNREQRKQIRLYNSIFYEYSFDNLEEEVKKVCKKKFHKLRCQMIFTSLITNIFYTLFLYLPITTNRKITQEKFIKISPMTNIFILPIKQEHLNSILAFCYLMQDHTFGNFKNAFLAQLLYDLITSH